MSKSELIEKVENLDNSFSDISESETNEVLSSLAVVNETTQDVESTEFSSIDMNSFGGTSSGGSLCPDPNRIECCQLGLQALSQTDTLYVQHCRKLHSLPCMLEIDSRDRYQVMNQFGQSIYFGIGSSNCWRWQLSGARPFQIQLFDIEGELKLIIKRPCTFGLFWWGGECDGNITRVYNWDDSFLGRSVQSFNALRPKYKVYNSQGTQIFCVRGPYIVSCPFFCLKCCSCKFKLYNRANTVGRFLEFPLGISPNNMSTALSLTFPMDLDPRDKAVLLGVLFQVYFLYYEKSDAVPGAMTWKRTFYSQTDSSARVTMRNVNTADIPVKCYACKIIGILLVVAFLASTIAYLMDEDIIKPPESSKNSSLQFLPRYFQL